MNGFMAAAGPSTRVLDLCERQNKVSLGLDGQTILPTILTHLPRRMEPRFHLSTAHPRVVSFPGDGVRPKELHAQDRRSIRRAA